MNQKRGLALIPARENQETGQSDLAANARHGTPLMMQYVSMYGDIALRLRIIIISRPVLIILNHVWKYVNPHSLLHFLVRQYFSDAWAILLPNIYPESLRPS
jgi:hypothetical protein